MAQENKQNLYLRYKTKQAHRIIIDDLSSIGDVKTWAKEAGVSTRWLCKAMKKEHGKSPKILLRKRRHGISCMSDRRP